MFTFLHTTTIHSRVLTSELRFYILQLNKKEKVEIELSHYLCCCWQVRSLRPFRGKPCVRSVRPANCRWTAASPASRTTAPETRPNTATRRTPAGRDGRGRAEAAARTGAPPGDWATWPESCGRRGWWRDGWGRRTAAVDSPPRTGCSRWCGSRPSAAGSCIHTWLRCCAAAAGGDGRAAATRLSPSAPAATDWRSLERHKQGFSFNLLIGCRYIKFVVKRVFLV